MLVVGFSPISPASAVQDAWSATVEAGRLAAESGERVELVEQRTETDRVFVNPDGTRTWERSMQPRFVRVDGEWRDVDTTLEVRDGRVAPRATALDVSFSAGGAGPLVAVAREGVQAEVAAPFALPEPVLSGDTATYGDVLPGVDLVVTAAPESFSQVLVVEDAAAAANPALEALVFGTEVAGGRLVEGEGESIAVVDDAGRVVLDGPPATMWDSAGEIASSSSALGVAPADQAREQGPVEGDAVEVMVAEVTAEGYTVRPDPSLLGGADTEYPVYIDPTAGAWRFEWAMVNRTYPTTRYVNWTATSEGMGYNNTSGTHLKRLYWEFDTTPFRWKQVLGARFSAYQTFSYSCTASDVELWWTGGIDGNTTWNTQGAWLRHLSTRTVAVGRDGCTPGGAWIEFDANSAMVETANNGGTQITLGMKARDEGSNWGWKRFRNDAVLSVTYNDIPGAPVETSTNGNGCFTSPDINHPGRPFVGTNNQLMSAKVHDPNGDNLQEFFEVWNWGGSYIRTIDTGTRASGVTFSGWTGALADGTYSWRAIGKDPWAWGPWSGWCEFTIDTVKPVQPAVTSAQYPENVLGAELGTPGAFRLSAGGSSDVTSYQYAFNSDTPSSTVTPTALGGSVDVTFTPQQFGTNFLTVVSYDRAGNPSPKRTYVFKVAGGDPTGEWFFDEGTGTSAASTTGSYPLALSGGAWWAGARETTDEFGFPVPQPGYGLGLDGVTGVAATTATQPLTTNRSFTVSAWVNVDPATAGPVTAVSQDGTSTGAFRLGYDPGTGRYAFAMAGSDVAAPTWTAATAATAATVGTWTHLVGVYDHQGKQLRLFVDGQLAATAAHTSSWSATGALRVGRLGRDGAAAQHWKGALDDVKAYRGPIDAASVQRLFDESRL